MYFIFYLLLLLTFSNCFAEEAKENFSAKISFPSSSLTINETLPITLDLVYPMTYSPDINSLRLNLFKYSGLAIPPFSLSSEIINPPHEISAGILSQKLIFNLDPIFPGKHYLTFQEITFNPAEGSQPPYQLISDIFEIDVSMPKSSFPSRDFIQPLIPLKQTIPIEISAQNRTYLFQNPDLQSAEINHNRLLFQRKGFPWAGLAFFILAGLVFLALKTQPNISKKATEPIQTPKIQLKTLTAIDQLARENLIETKQFDRLFTNLSFLVRTFIEKRYQVRSSTYTTQEFLEKISKSSLLDDKKKIKLTEFLNSSDRVKFAKYDPTKDECEQALQDARGFIKNES